MYWGITQCKNDNMTVLLVVTFTVLVVVPLVGASTMSRGITQQCKNDNMTVLLVVTSAVLVVVPPSGCLPIGQQPILPLDTYYSTVHCSTACVSKR